MVQYKATMAELKLKETMAAGRKEQKAATIEQLNLQ